jgi:hypothetical protein
MTILDTDNSESESESTTNVQYTQNINIALKETPSLVTLFRKSPLKNITLQKHVKEEFGHELNLLLDVRPRWNSMMQMVERFPKLKNAIKKALIDLNIPSMWSDGIDSNTGVLESLLDVLYPVKLPVEALSRKDATILTSEAIIDVLINKLQSMENDLAIQFLEYLKNNINDRRNVNLISLISYLHNPTTFNNDTNRVNRPNCSKTALIKFTEKVYNRLFPSPSNTLEDDFQIQSNEHDPNTANFRLQLIKMAIEPEI